MKGDLVLYNCVDKLESPFEGDEFSLYSVIYPLMLLEFKDGNFYAKSDG